jgi:hypothetical protein
MQAEGRANENEPIQRTSLTQAAALLTGIEKEIKAAEALAKSTVTVCVLLVFHPVPGLLLVIAFDTCAN